MARDTQEPETDEQGYEHHPAFGMINVSRVSTSTPGAVLFDSDIRHQHSVVLSIGTAYRKREINHDWTGEARQFVAVEMSEAQWASFVSSMNTSGVPCTIRHRTEGTHLEFAPGLPFAPRMRESINEVHGAADRAFAKIKAAMAAYEALPSTPAKAKKDALRSLRAAIDNATSNVAYAGESLVEHVENVVQRARADIEAMVVHQAAQLGLEPGSVTAALEIEGGGR